MKILLICESFSTKASGGRVVRYLHKILTARGHDVRVVITSAFNQADSWAADGDRFISAILGKERRFRKLYSLIVPHDVPDSFRRLIDEFQPDVAHFSSFDHTKSPNLYSYCASRGIRTVMQPYTMHFYCAQGFGYLRGQTCRRCLDESFLTAVVEGCTTLRGTIDQVERVRLRETVLRSADALLSSNSDLDGVLRAYGIPDERIHRFPVVFDPEGVAPTATHRGEDYIYYGQAVAHKGIDFLIDLFLEMPERTLRIYPMAPFTTTRPLPHNIKVIPGLSLDNGLVDIIANARAVLLPSLWMTSTEYSLCEAMMLRKPVIVFAVGVHKEILTDRENAMIVESGNKAQFKAALDELDADPNLYDRLAAAGGACIVELNAPDRLHGLLMTAYQRF